MSTNAAKYAEKLIILCDHAVGVQARLYQLVDYKRPALFAKDTDIEKFARQFLKKFPEFPDTLNKEKGADTFKQRAPEITAAIADYYFTFMEVLNFSDEAWKVLTELAGGVQEFKFETNIDLLSYYFNLFTRYAQIHMLVHLIDTPQLFLASYARAYHHTSGNTEAHFARIAKYLAAFKPTATTSPLKKLQDDAQAISLCVGNTLMSFLPLIQRYSSVQGYMAQGKLFNIVQEDPKNLTWGFNEKTQLEATHLANLRNWVLWGFLLCPGELGRPGALDLLSLCLRETFLLQIYRDKNLSIHREFDELMDYKSANGAFKLSKHKKIFKDAYSDDEGTRQFHSGLRTYFSTELEQFESFFNEAPSLVPAKLQMIFALLALSRNEVLWFFRHQHVVPFKCSSSKIKGLAWDPTVLDLIHRCFRLSKLVENNRKEIQAHYVEWLTKQDAAKAREVGETFINAVHNPGLSQLIHNMVDNLHERQVGDNLEAIRLNWYRISASIAHSSSAVPSVVSAPVSAIMNRVVMHSRNIDCIDTQLKNHGSFSQLFWYRTDLMEALKLSLASIDGRAAYCISLTQVLGHALHNVHRLAPEEQPTIGRESILDVNQYITGIVTQVVRCVQAIANDTATLRSRTNHQAVLQRINHQTQMALNPTSVHPLPQPGDESLYGNRRQVQNLAVAHRTISDVGGAISQTDLLVVYNHEFSPREYLYESLTTLLRNCILNLCVQGPAIQKPTGILAKLKDTVYALSHVERALNVNIADIVRDVLLSELSPSPEEIQALHAAEPDPNKHVPVIMHVASFYSSMFATDIALQHGIVYSMLRKCFISKNKAAAAANANPNQPIGGQSNAAQEFERFTDVHELRALCTLIGPAGVSVIERGLLKLVFRFAKVVKDVLLANQTVLLNLSNRFTEQSVWLDNIGILTKMDELCSALTCIGCILHFRLMLRSALHETVEQSSPFILSAVSMAHRAMHDSGGVVVEPRLAALDGLASDVGLDVGEADHPLRLALAPLKTSVADINMLGFLPELFGLMYLSSRWRNAQFSIELEGHTQNNHCMALAIRQLLAQFARVHVKESPPVPEIERRITTDMERFLRCSAFTMLHLRVLNSREGATGSPFQLPHIMIFLEQIVTASGGRLEMSMLEACFPYTMLRENAIQVYEKQTNVHSNAPTADETD